MTLLMTRTCDHVPQTGNEVNEKDESYKRCQDVYYQHARHTHTHTHTHTGRIIIIITVPFSTSNAMSFLLRSSAKASAYIYTAVDNR